MGVLRAVVAVGLPAFTLIFVGSTQFAESVTSVKVSRLTDLAESVCILAPSGSAWIACQYKGDGGEEAQDGDEKRCKHIDDVGGGNCADLEQGGESLFCA
ncbi:hypothetical protein FGB62_15g00 [Gracilaria domingensis]|nr:hypothetical protein FGB62_15g00 [Gracilaria domingensis]